MSLRKLLCIVFLTCLAPWTGVAEASTVASKWYFGIWSDCKIDSRSARMQWRVVANPPKICKGNICRGNNSSVKVLGRFSDNGNAWIPLKIRYLRGNDLGIRYLGAEQNDWFLRYNPGTKIARGFATWRGKNYPLRCRR
jgi:Family of unknown function (DUF6006)